MITTPPIPRAITSGADKLDAERQTPERQSGVTDFVQQKQNPGATLPAAVIEPCDLGSLAGTASLSAFSPNLTPEVALYEPGNEELCRKLLDQAVAADPRTFTLGDRSGPLVILRVPSEEVLPSETKWEGDLPGTTLATPADVVERAQRIPWHRRGKGQGLHRIHAPRLFASDYLVQMRGRYGAPVLTGISRVPAIEDDGSVRFPSGHDHLTGLYYDRPIKFEIPELVSHDDARVAAEQLLIPFAEYNLGEPNEAQAVIYALVFSALRRPHLPAAPMFVVRSSMAGTGKGLLLRSAAQLAYSTAPTILTWGGSAEEFEKRLASVMLQMPAVLNIDNANGMMVAGDLLESLITEGTADIRPLGRSETIKVRNRSFIGLTGNNPIITGDMARRTIVLDVVPRSADPERDRYNSNPVDLVVERRPEFLRCAYTAMRGFRQAGMPSGGLAGVGSFDAWSHQVRDLVYWLTDHDVSECFRRNKAEDPRRQNDASLLAALHGHFGAAPFRAAEVILIHQAVADHRRTPHMHLAPKGPELFVHDALDDVLGSRGVNAKLLGYWARRIRGAHYGGFVLETQHDAATNSNTITISRK
jgi:putative DNA primase/helicase